MFITMLIAQGGCIGGTIDRILIISGTIVDENAIPYEECELLLLEEGDRNEFSGRAISNGNISTSYTYFHSIRKFRFEVKCDASDEQYTSKYFDIRDNPIDLGEITLPKNKGVYH